jgi:hypothetical protein
MGEKCFNTNRFFRENTLISPTSHLREILRSTIETTSRFFIQFNLGRKISIEEHGRANKM